MSASGNIVSCPGCQTKIRVGTGGQTYRCPKCSTQFKVSGTATAGNPTSKEKKTPAQTPAKPPQAGSAPVGRPTAPNAKPTGATGNRPAGKPAVARQPGAKPAAPRQPAAPTAGGLDDLFGGDSFGGGIPSSTGQTFASSPMAGGVAKPNAYAPPTSSASMPKRASSSSGAGMDDALFWKLLYATIGLTFAGILLAIVSGFILPFASVIIIFGMLGIGILITNITAIWVLVIAFKEDVTAGLLSLFLPFYPIYYVATRWSKCWQAVGLFLAGLFMFCSGMGFFCAGVAIAAAANQNGN